jgi:cyanophycinase
MRRVPPFGRGFAFAGVRLRALGLGLMCLAGAGAPQATATEHLMLVGGGSTPPAALTRFVEWAGNQKANFLIVTWAGDEPEASYKWMQEELTPFHPAAIVAAPFGPMMKDPAQKALFLNQLSQATAVFFTGGDQNRAMDVISDETVLSALRQRYQEGVAFGGTSAGTAIMSKIMITGEGDFTVVNWNQVKTREGLGVLPGVIVDQHFVRRQRENRLMGLVLHYRTLLGIGVDENNAFAVEGNRFGEAFGPTQVVVMDGRDPSGKLSLELLKAGDRYDLWQRHRVL